MLTGIYILAIFLCAPLWGRASDRWGRRPVIVVGLAGFAVASLPLAYAESISLLYAGRFLAGAFAAAITPVAHALVGDHAPSGEWRARRLAFVNAAGMAGLFVGPVLSGIVFRMLREMSSAEPEQALSGPFAAASALALFAALAIRFLVPQAGQVGDVAIKTGETRYGRSVMARLWGIASVTAVAVGTFEVGLSLRGKQILGLDAYALGMMFAECSLVMFAIQALVFSPLVRPNATRLFLTPGLAFLAVGLVAVPWAASYLGLTVVVALVAASAGILSPIVTYWVSIGAGDTLGADLGRATAAASIGQAVGSALGGILFDLPNLQSAAFGVAAVAVLGGFAMSLGLPSKLLPAQRDIYRAE